MAKLSTVVLQPGQTLLVHACGLRPERVVVNTERQAIFVGTSLERVRLGNAPLIPPRVAGGPPSPSVVLGPRNLLYVGIPVVAVPAVVTLQVTDLDEFGYDLHS